MQSPNGTSGGNQSSPSGNKSSGDGDTGNDQNLSNSNQLSTPQGASSSHHHVSPHELFPIPQAPAKTDVQRKRRSEVSTILTSSPYKEQLINSKDLKTNKTGMKNQTKVVKVKQVKVKMNRPTSRPTAKKKLNLQKNSENAVANPSETVTSMEIDDGPVTTEIDSIQTQNYAAGDYVIIKFETKRKEIHYVGQLFDVMETEDIESSDGDWMIKYFKRETQSNFKFIVPENTELFDVTKRDIVAKLPKPLQGAKTSRLARHLVFPYDFSKYSYLS